MNLYQLHSNPKSLHLHDEAHEHVPQLVWEKYKDNPEELKKRESIWSKDVRYAYKYAMDILKSPFKGGEAIIAKNAYFAYYYAELIKNEFI